MTGDSDDVELRHKSGESLELQTSSSAPQSQSTTVVVRLTTTSANNYPLLDNFFSQLFR